MKIKHKNEDFALTLNLLDCKNQLIRPENCEYMRFYVYTQNEDEKVSVPVNQDNDIYINGNEISMLENGTLKYVLEVGFKSDYYSDKQKDMIMRGETQIYLTD